MISIVIPIYNEEAVLPTLFNRLDQCAASWNEAYEILLIDDGSQDGSLEYIRRKTQEDSNYRAVFLSRNFGHQAAISAGIDYALGDAVIIMDGDLQDPPEIIQEFLEEWRKGFDVVYAMRKTRKEGIFKRLSYSIFYRVLALLSEIKIPLDTGDFCLMDKKVVDVLKIQLPENIRFVRGLRAFAGFKQKGISFDRQERTSGKPKYTLRKLIKLSLDGLFDFSLVPLRIATYVGFIIAIPSFFVGVYFIIHRIFGFPVFGKYASETPGLTSLSVGVFFLGGIGLIIMGILGEYVGRIYIEVKRRPNYIVSATIPDRTDLASIPKRRKQTQKTLVE